jgi:hypothetical protein
MIDVKSTVYKSINDAFGKLRYQAKDDPKAFRSMLEVSIVDYMLHWASGMLEPQAHLQKLVDLRHDLLMCNPALRIQHIDSTTAYVNVNTPQSNDDWKRVWDSQNIIDITDTFTPISDIPEGYIPIYEIVLEDIIPDVDTRLIPIYSIILDNIIK